MLPMKENPNQSEKQEPEVIEIDGPITKSVSIKPCGCAHIQFQEGVVDIPFPVMLSGGFVISSKQCNDGTKQRYAEIPIHPYERGLN